MIAYIREVDGEVTINPEIGESWIARGCTTTIVDMGAAGAALIFTCLV